MLAFKHMTKPSLLAYPFWRFWPLHEKILLCCMRTIQTQISLRTCAVPSAPLMFTFSKAYGPLRDKTRIRGLRQSETQTSPTSYWDQPEYLNLAHSKLRYHSFYETNNKGADQSARMCRLVCALVARKPPKTGFLTSRPRFCVIEHIEQGTLSHA